MIKLWMPYFGHIWDLLLYLVKKDVILTIPIMNPFKISLIIFDFEIKFLLPFLGLLFIIFLS